MAFLPAEKILLVALGNLLLQFVYTCYAYSGFLKLKSAGDIFLVIVANIVGVVLWFTLLVIAKISYIIFF